MALLKKVVEMQVWQSRNLFFFLELPFCRKCRQGVKPDCSEVPKEMAIGCGLRLLKKIINF